MTIAETDEKRIGTLIKDNVYDEAGQLIQTLDGGGSGVSYTYDLGGRKTRIATTGQDSQSYTYDALGHLIGIVDGEGNETRYGLDHWGRIVDIEKVDGSHEYYGYDYAGNLISATDGEGHTTSWCYNRNNQLAVMRDAEGKQETYAYDAQGRLCKKTDRNGIETRYTYTLYGNLLSRRAGELVETYIEGVKPGKRGAYPGKAPTVDLSWHHEANREGIMQLVPSEEHSAGGELQKILHPDQRGGMENWGGGR